MNKEKVKEFLSNHKEDIAIVLVSVISYKTGQKFGYSKGYSAGMNKMTGIANNAIKVSMRLCDELEGFDV